MRSAGRILVSKMAKANTLRHILLTRSRSALEYGLSYFVVLSAVIVSTDQLT